jgi:hypothetical protein
MEVLKRRCSMSNGSWQPDPHGRHQLRWWDGTQWTSSVSDNGVTQDEGAAPMAPPVPAAPPAMALPVPTMPATTMPASQPVKKRPSRNVVIGIVAVIVLAVAGVIVATRGDSGKSGDSQTAAGKKYVAAMVASGKNNDQFTTTEMQCLASGIIDIVGVATLQKAGVTPEAVAANTGTDLMPGFTPTKAQANQIVDMIFRCVDFGKQIAAQMAGSSVKLSTTQVQCIGNKLEQSEVFHTYLADTMFNKSGTGSAAAPTAEIVSIVKACGVTPSGS